MSAASGIGKKHPARFSRMAYPRGQRHMLLQEGCL